MKRRQRAGKWIGEKTGTGKGAGQGKGREKVNERRMAAAAAAVLLASALSAVALTGCSGGAQSAAQTDGETAGREAGNSGQGTGNSGQETGNSGQRTGDSDQGLADPGQEQDLLARIRERGTITIAMEGTWAPWTYHNEEDELVGYDVEIGEQIAESLGVEAEFVEGEWDGLLAGLDAGRYDLMINGVDITPERAEKYDFSIPYAYNRTAVIVRADDDRIRTMEDLAGMHTANTISSTYAELAEQYGAEVTGVDDLNQTFELLLSGRIDATLNAEVSYYDYTKVHPEAPVKIAALADEATQVAIPLKEGDDTKRLREAVDQALEEMRESGELAALSEKYFGVDISNEEEGTR